MPTTENIILNGELSTLQECGAKINSMLSSNYVYQHIHTFEHKALNLSEHISLIDTALSHIRNRESGFSEGQTQEFIYDLLRSNRYPKQSNKVTIRVFTNSTGDESHSLSYIIQVTEQLLYARYNVWHTRPILEIYSCEYPYMGYTTAISQLSARYGRDFASRNTAEIAVIQRHNGILTNIDDEPLFLVFGNEIVTSPLHEGANDSVMRRLTFRAAEAEGIKISEHPLERAMLNSCDEAFTLSTQGIISIGGYKKARYYNLMANRLTSRFNKLIQL